MIYPGKSKSKMVQVFGSGNKVQASLEGAERIYSRGDTKKIVSMAKSAKSDADLVSLGKFMVKATIKQDTRDPEYVDA